MSAHSHTVHCSWLGGRNMASRSRRLLAPMPHEEFKTCSRHGGVAHEKRWRLACRSCHAVEAGDHGVPAILRRWRSVQMNCACRW